MKTVSCCMGIVLLTFGATSIAETILERFERVVRERQQQELPKNVEEQEVLLRKMYGTFTVKELFDVVRLKNDAFEEAAPSDSLEQVPREFAAYQQVAIPFWAMQYATTNDFWRDVLSELENPANSPLDLLVTLQALDTDAFTPGPRLAELLPKLQNIYRSDAYLANARALAIGTTGHLLSDEFNRIFRGDPVVRAYQEEHRKLLPTSSPELTSLPLTPTTEAALKEPNRRITAFIHEMVALYQSVDAPEIKRAAHGAVYGLCTKPSSGKESALAFLEDVERAKTEALAAESKRMGKRSPEFKSDWSRFTEKPKDMPDDDKQENNELQEDKEEANRSVDISE